MLASRSATGDLNTDQDVLTLPREYGLRHVVLGEDGDGNLADVLRDASEWTVHFDGKDVILTPSKVSGNLTWELTGSCIAAGSVSYTHLRAHET